MSSSSEGCSDGSCSARSRSKYRGIRRRKWGKWVSEIRVPGTGERLWLGSYAAPEAAAVAHDVALYCLRGSAPAPGSFNFPMMLPGSARIGMSPAEVQRAASDAGLAVDARFLDSEDASQPQKRRRKVLDETWAAGGLVGEEIWGDDRTWDWDRSAASGEQLSISVNDYLQ